MSDYLQAGRDLTLSLLIVYPSIAPSTSPYYESTIRPYLKLLKSPNENILDMYSYAFNSYDGIMLNKSKSRQYDVYGMLLSQVTLFYEEMFQWRVYYDPSVTYGKLILSDVGLHELYGDIYNDTGVEEISLSVPEQSLTPKSDCLEDLNGRETGFNNIQMTDKQECFQSKKRPFTKPTIQPLKLKSTTMKLNSAIEPKSSICSSDKSGASRQVFKFSIDETPQRQIQVKNRPFIGPAMPLLSIPNVPLPRNNKAVAFDQFLPPHLRVMRYSSQQLNLSELCQISSKLIALPPNTPPTPNVDASNRKGVPGYSRSTRRVLTSHNPSVAFRPQSMDISNGRGNATNPPDNAKKGMSDINLNTSARPITTDDPSLGTDCRSSDLPCE